VLASQRGDDGEPGEGPHLRDCLLSMDVEARDDDAGHPGPEATELLLASRQDHLLVEGDLLQVRIEIAERVVLRDLEIFEPALELLQIYWMELDGGSRRLLRETSLRGEAEGLDVVEHPGLPTKGQAELLLGSGIRELRLGGRSLLLAAHDGISLGLV